MIYRDVTTTLHRTHPATKIAGLLLFFVWAVAPTDLWAAVLPLVFALILVRWAGAGENLWRVRSALMLLFIFSVAFWTLRTTGRTLYFHLGEFRVYRESLLYATAVGLRLDAMLIAGIVLLTCTKVEEFSLGLERLRVPYPIAFTISLAFRLVPTFASTAATIAQAQKARGLQLDRGNLFTRIKNHVPLIIPVFVSAIRNSDLMAMALESRGFHPTKERTSYLDIPFGAKDAITVLLMFAFAVGAWWLRLRGIGVAQITIK